jgi:hypothetical protein
MKSVLPVKDFLHVPIKDYFRYVIHWEFWDEQQESLKERLSRPDRQDYFNYFFSEDCRDEGRDHVLFLICLRDTARALFAGVYEIYDITENTIRLLEIEEYKKHKGAVIENIKKNSITEPFFYKDLIENNGATQVVFDSLFHAILSGYKDLMPERIRFSSSEQHDLPSLEIGSRLVPLAEPPYFQILLSGIDMLRESYSPKIPPIRICYSPRIESLQYSIYVEGKRIIKGFASEDAAGNLYPHATEKILLDLEIAIIESSTTAYTKIEVL